MERRGNNKEKGGRDEALSFRHKCKDADRTSDRSTILQFWIFGCHSSVRRNVWPMLIDMVKERNKEAEISGNSRWPRR